MKDTISVALNVWPYNIYLINEKSLKNLKIVIEKKL